MERSPRLTAIVRQQTRVLEKSWYNELVRPSTGLVSPREGKSYPTPRKLTGLALIAFMCLTPVALAAESAEDRDSAIVGKYVDATHVQQEALKGLEMEMDVEAKLPRLSKQGKLRVLRKISRLGQITYKALGFSGDNTVKQEVIARYLSAEAEARNNGSIAITPENYKFRYAGRLVQQGQTIHLFELTPRKKAVGLFKGELWIDAATGMPIRESGQFVKSPSVFLKKIAFVRDYELQDGVALPKHIASTVDTRIVGRAELDIAFSHFSKEHDEAGDATADQAGSETKPETNSEARQNAPATPNKSALQPQATEQPKITTASAEEAQ